MTVTIKTAPHSANKFKEYYRETVPTDANCFFNQEQSFQQSATKVLGSSFDPTQRIYYTPNGLVQTVLQAYNAHHNLVIRPDDVWIAIISQLSFHINSNAEELRNKFVAHEGTERELAHAHFREWMKEGNIARVELRVNGTLHTLYKGEGDEAPDKMS